MKVKELLKQLEALDGEGSIGVVVFTARMRYHGVPAKIVRYEEIVPGAGPHYQIEIDIHPKRRVR